VSPLGCGSEAVWNRLLKGACGLRSIDHSGLDSEIADVAKAMNVNVIGTVPRSTESSEGDGLSFRPHEHFGRSVDKEMATFIQYALRASDLALAHAQIAPLDTLEGKGSSSAIADLMDPTRAGTAIASGIGAIDDTVAAHESLKKSPRKLSPYFVPKVLVNMGAGQVAIRHGLRGPSHRYSLSSLLFSSLLSLLVRSLLLFTLFSCISKQFILRRITLHLKPCFYPIYDNIHHPSCLPFQPYLPFTIYHFSPLQLPTTHDNPAWPPHVPPVRMQLATPSTLSAWDTPISCSQAAPRAALGHWQLQGLVGCAL
jgi:hypothetical protein